MFLDKFGAASVCSVQCVCVCDISVYLDTTHKHVEQVHHLNNTVTDSSHAMSNMGQTLFFSHVGEIENNILWLWLRCIM